MKINDIRQYGVISNYKKTGETKSIGATGKKASQKDEVQISSDAKELAAQQSNPLTSEERAETIKHLKEAIANKTYHVDSDLLADRMIQYFKNSMI